MSDPQHSADSVIDLDPRVRRTRAALLVAAVRVVTEHATADFSVTELAEAAEVSRRVLYQHFGDRDGLLVAAAVELMTSELAPAFSELARATLGPAPEQATAMVTEFAAHFAAHRRFYRALLTGSCAYAVHRRVGELFAPFSQAAARQLFGDLDEPRIAEVAGYFTAGTTMSFTEWIIDGPEPLDPQQFADRLSRVQSVLAAGRPHTNQQPVQDR
ncbi:TetR/AcrR family transcriptional regulator [Nocardia sp. NPDC055321]